MRQLFKKPGPFVLQGSKIPWMVFLTSDDQVVFFLEKWQRRRRVMNKLSSDDNHLDAAIQLICLCHLDERRCFEVVSKRLPAIMRISEF